MAALRPLGQGGTSGGVQFFNARDRGFPFSGSSTQILAFSEQVGSQYDWI
jgi:hypothetical protein